MTEEGFVDPLVVWQHPASLMLDDPFVLDDDFDQGLHLGIGILEGFLGFGEIVVRHEVDQLAARRL